TPDAEGCAGWCQWCGISGERTTGGLCDGGATDRATAEEGGENGECGDNDGDNGHGPADFGGCSARFRVDGLDCIRVPGLMIRASRGGTCWMCGFIRLHVHCVLLTPP